MKIQIKLNKLKYYNDTYADLIIMGLLVTLICLFLLSILIFVSLWPLVLIWAINGLFNTSIEYSFTNWFIVIILSILTRIKFNWT